MRVLAVPEYICPRCGWTMYRQLQDRDDPRNVVSGYILRCLNEACALQGRQFRVDAQTVEISEA